MTTPIPSNQSAFTLAEVVEATGGRLHSSMHTGVGLVLGVSIDTRSLTPGSLFVALRGASSDGHDYLALAAERETAAAIVETARQHPALDCIEVHDTLAALGRLAHFHLARVRAARGLPVIAIGGAVGKTSTKEITAAVTRALFGKILSTPGNLNHLVGVPMTIFTVTRERGAALSTTPAISLLGQPARLTCPAAVAGLAAMRSPRFSASNLSAVAGALASVRPVAGRLSASSIRGILVIDDSYNSNPRSLRASLAAAREVADGLGARLVIAMGDMLELGAMSAPAHQDAIREIMREQPATFVAVGPEMRTALESVAGSKLPPNVLVAPDSLAAATPVAGLVRSGDVLLIKGSRGIAMEKIIAALA